MAEEHAERIIELLERLLLVGRIIMVATSLYAGRFVAKMFLRE